MRYKILQISPFIFVDFFKYGADKVKVVDPLPEDAKFVRAYTNDPTGWGYISLVIESQFFDEVKDGDVIPVIPHPSFEKVL